MSATDPLRIAIVGAGAIGGWIAGKLALAGAQVSLLTRGDSLAALRSEGLTLQEGDRRDRIRVDATNHASDLGAQDLVILAVKAPALADAAEAARPLIAADTLIVPMLNGVPWWFLEQPLMSVDPEGRIAAALPERQLIGCVVHAACSRAGHHHVVITHSDKLILGEPGGGLSDRVARVADPFRRAGIPVDESEDVRRAIWYKLWGNATINPLSALTRATADELLADSVLRAFMLDAMAELAAIGAVIGCPISESGDDRMAVTARLGAFKTSMLQDVESGRPIELEALLGAPREIASNMGVECPSLDRLYAMTRLLARNLQLL